MLQDHFIRQLEKWYIQENKSNSFCGKIEIKTSKNNISKIVGNKKSNRLYFKDNYNIILDLVDSYLEDTLVIDGENIDISFLK